MGIIPRLEILGKDEVENGGFWLGRRGLERA